MTATRAFVIILVTAVCTLITRLVPFALFGGKKPFLILDDPFINLDDEKVKSAMELLRRIARERQILYVCCHTSRA